MDTALFCVLVLIMLMLIGGGAGDITPSDNGERIVAMCIMLLGEISLACTVRPACDSCKAVSDLRLIAEPFAFEIPAGVLFFGFLIGAVGEFLEVGRCLLSFAGMIHSVALLRSRTR